jgi:DNA-directed RNA polymerase subunit omega
MARVTVEDCLRKEPNRFALVVLAYERTKQLLKGEASLLDHVRNKPVVTALREIATGKVRLMTPEDQERVEARERKARQQALARIKEVQESRSAIPSEPEELLALTPQAVATPSIDLENQDENQDEDQGENQEEDKGEDEDKDEDDLDDGNESGPPPA